MQSMSSLERQPFSLVIVIDSVLPLQGHNLACNTYITSTEYSRSLVGSADLHDTVGINLKGNLNLRNITKSWGSTSKLELAEVVIVLSQRMFILEDLDQHGVLVIGSSQ